MQKTEDQVSKTQAQLVHWGEVIRAFAAQGGATHVIRDYSARIRDLRAKHEFAQSQLEVLSEAGSAASSRGDLRVACLAVEAALSEFSGTS